MDDARRKIEHIEICLREDVDFEDNCESYFREIILIHQALPGVSYSDVDTVTKFLGYTLNAPILIEAMTGGHPQLKHVNEELAKLAEELKLAIGLGSEKPIIKSGFSREVVETYRVVREIARSVPVIGNIGITLLHETTIDVIKRLVEVVEVDALAIHLNPAQEVIQPEGDHDFSAVLLSKVSELTKELKLPIIIKEVGHGLSMEVVKSFRERGVRIFDVAGACGTNWIKVEALRNPDNSVKREVGLLFSKINWGIPTPLSLIESRWVAPDAFIIASGGVWNGVNATKLIALGANMVGVAKPILKTLIKHGYESARKYLEKYITEIKTTMFLIGASEISELCFKPLVLGSTIKYYVESRGINAKEYIEKTRCGVVK
ncbi:MAG: type 2 isopentenyl-diphosphate Delta-isomerase [Desulfurococcaceae archaeon]